MDPRLKDLTQLTDAELTEKMSKILDRMHFALGTGHTALYNQANNIYLELLAENQRRAQTPVAEDEEDPFEGLINIKKK